jgi:insertion element IS1 protein InsB
LGDAVEIDELVVNVTRKRRHRYLWIAVSRDTRQVLGFYLGSRQQRSLQTLWRALPATYRRKLVYTDRYEVYAAFFRAWQHRPCDKGSGQTSIVEGLNNKWRARVSSLVRRTVCVRHEADLLRRLWLVMEHHNGQCLQRVQRLGWLPSPTP